ncbi:putative src homology 3 domains containing protein [Lyophyllum shimeji]|uniref:Src homology 3 domains containing protein n=1 Tax=Lyophyllum shimeji TaxID=47721 RepID=A0A9P3PD25_LYOSH|nr:putative src homology 3 domains containing protein [Lyophyllum shimeji]
MVFANLQNHEKDAFFSLLDEYFASRPDVFGNTGGSLDGAGSSAGGAAASAVHRALASNPEATSHLVSAGLRHSVHRSSPSSAAASDPEVGNAAGRVAAAALAFSGRNNATSPPPTRTGPPIAQKPAGASGLMSTKKFGDVDTTSTKNMFGSLYTANKAAPQPQAPPPAPAFAPKKNAFAPPPVRRASATSEAPSPPQRHQPSPEPEPEEEVQGEWAEALYDYDSGEAGDLAIKEGERVLVTERTSDDWWTGEYGGRKGLFPASYVKIL